MRQLVIIIIVMGVLALAACATPNARKTQRLEIGMTRAEVVAAMGEPTSVGADRQSEVSYYRMIEGTLGGAVHTFFVRFVDGKVESFGRLNEPEAPAVMPPPPPPPVVLPSTVPPMAP
jgi:hypothetical protein